MKTKKNTFLFYVVFITIGLSIYSCKKSSTTTTTTTTLTPSDLIMQSASDDQNVEAAQAAVDVDVINFMSGLNYFAKKKGINVDSVPCGISVVSKIDSTKTYNIKYSGISCLNSNRVKTGSITIKLIKGNQWSDVGAMIQYSYNVSVTKIYAGMTYNLKGLDTIKNVNGGLLWPLSLISGNETVIHQIHGTDIITFPDGTSRTWKHSVQRQWVYNTGNFSLTVTGLGIDSVYTNLDTWGVNRKGDKFYTKIDSSIVSTSACDYAPNTGMITHTIVSATTSEAGTVTLIYGVDANGNVVTPPTCATDYKITWLAKDGSTGNAVIAY